MIDPSNIPVVADNELLARFIVYSDEKRSDGTVKHKLFLPYKLVELSVNRHREATIEETWQAGRDVASERQRTLHGVANIRASSCRTNKLDVKPDPQLPKNPNHANLVGYPPAKEDQMAIAKILAASIEGKWQEPPAQT
ncbi:MAG: hypothetical protein NTU79_23905 [Planctomycetota bacterium]|nr:hypothetical protein [Planctomycetota bacterium]